MELQGHMAAEEYESFFYCYSGKDVKENYKLLEDKIASPKPTY